MLNNVGCIAVGREFKSGGTTYVRIPEMILSCSGIGFVVNVINIENSDNQSCTPKIIASFIHPDVVVDVL